MWAGIRMPKQVARAWSGRSLGRQQKAATDSKEQIEARERKDRLGSQQRSRHMGALEENRAQNTKPAMRNAVGRSSRM